MITNAFSPWLRDLPHFEPNFPLLCTDKGLTEPCFYLLLEENTFDISGRNSSFIDSSYVGKSTEFVDKIRNEGIVLFLNTFNGPIYISKNTFRYADNFLNFYENFSSSCYFSKFNFYISIKKFLIKQPYYNDAKISRWPSNKRLFHF